MSEWTTQTLQFGHATIIVHRPVLTEEERAKRERQVLDAMTGTMRDYFKSNQKRGGNP